MNKRQLFLIVPILLLASCQREMDVSDQFKAPDITAEIQAETRTVLSVDEYGAGTIYWKSADQIDVFIGDNKLVYTSQNSSNAATATFKTNDGLSGNYPDSEPVLAIYPSYEESYINEWGDRLVCSYLPSQQYGLPGTFDDDLFMAVATGTKQIMGSSTPLSFHNICSGLKFSLSRDDITCVKFRGTDSSYGNPVVLAGDVFFEFDGSWSGSSSGATEITLYPKSGGTFQKDAYYYIICFPASLRDFYVDFETTSGASATLRGIEYNQARGVLIDEPFEFRKSIFMKKTHIDEYAKFSDEDVPHTQIKYWTSGRPDSIWQNAPEGGYYEWFGVEPFKNESVYDQSAGIGYGEFFFNSPVTRIGPSLFKNSNLTQIYLPMSITEIGNSAFEGSSSLTYLSVPQSLVSIGSRAFYGCSSLESRSLYIPDSVTSIGSQAYENCLNLTSLEIPSSVTDIGVEAFGGCVGLASIIVDSSNPVFDSRENCNAIIRIDTNELVSGCKNTVIPNSVTKIGACAFYGCSGLASIEIPSSVSHIGISAFTYCTGLTSITVYADTPPQLDNHLVFSGTNNCPIYVPAGSVAAYKSAWSEYADRIRPNVEAVDLGLPSGVQWATCNVGASSPEEYGDYYAWGETTPKSNYDWSTYLWCNGSETALTKYNNKSENGVVDHKIVLDLDDDVAHVNWGGNWRMPTSTELQELKSNCTWTLTTQGGKKGYRATSKLNGNSVFFPSAGGKVGSSLQYADSFGLYWSSSLLLESMKDAHCLDLTSTEVQILPGRTTGVSVRPVYGGFVPVQSVSLNQTSLALTEGNSFTLTATVTPSYATEKTVSWSSSNTSIVTVSSKGGVKAVSAGTATITAWASDGEHSATCTVTVTTPYHAVDMCLSVQWASCNVGASSPEDYGDYFAWGETAPKSGYYDWSSYLLCNGTYRTLTKYNLVEDYGTVDNKTILEPSDDAAHVNWGEGWRMPTQSEIQELWQHCTFTWTTQGGTQGYRVTSDVNGNIIFLPAAGVRNGLTPYDLGSIGSYWTISSCLDMPGYACRMEFEPSGNGLGGFYRSYGMAVRPVYGEFVSVESISLDKTSVDLEIGATSTLYATILPSNASEKHVTWSSDNPSVATVSLDGLLRAVSVGEATITAMTDDGMKVATCAVVVSPVTVAVTGVSLDKTTLTLTVGDTYAFTATVTPSNATDKSVTWSSSNTSVATVSSSGVVTAKKVGTSTITVTTIDGSKTATCALSVEAAPIHVTGVSLNKTALTLAAGGTYTLVATVSPSNATDKSLTWSSSNTSVATVSATGIVTAKMTGTATITVTTTDRGKTATCVVTVSARKTGTENGHEWVDLGLPSGLKWATSNVGATSPEAYGEYFAWGEMSSKSDYQWSTYRWCNGSYNTLTKYNTSSNYGTVDNRTVLLLSNDAAYVNWGGSWRMPTDEEMEELLTKCSWEWTTENGVIGEKGIGPNGNSIFLPAAGRWEYTTLSYAGTGCYYWSSSLYTSFPNNAWSIMGSGVVSRYNTFRYYGFSVRPVKQ